MGQCRSSELLGHPTTSHLISRIPRSGFSECKSVPALKCVALSGARRGKPCNVGPILHLAHSRGETCGTLSGKPILATQFGVRQHALTGPAV